MVRIDGLMYPVVELSEFGMRIVVGSETDFLMNSALSGHVVFSDQSSEVVAGEVLRAELADDDFSEVIVQLTTGVSLKRMLAEQMRIRNQYPRFIDPSGARNAAEISRALPVFVDVSGVCGTDWLACLSGIWSASSFRDFETDDSIYEAVES